MPTGSPPRSRDSRRAASSARSQHPCAPEVRFIVVGYAFFARTDSTQPRNLMPWRRRGNLVFEPAAKTGAKAEEKRPSTFRVPPPAMS